MAPQSNLFNLKPSSIIMYGASWCPDCRRAKNFFNKHKIEYEDVGIEETPDATPFVKKINNGMRIIPTIIFPDGEILVEPSDAQLAKKLGL
jgi:glutaredoxin-like protein